MSVEVRALVFVGTRTPAADAMAAFVRDVLGLAPRDEDGAAYFDLPDGSSFAVQPTQQDEPVERTVGFLVDDLDASRRDLEAAGAEVVSSYGPNDDGYEAIHFRAPDGNVYEIVRDPAREARARGRRPS